METEKKEWLRDLLQEVQLEQFYVKIRDTLQVTRSVKNNTSYVSFLCLIFIEDFSCHTLCVNRLKHFEYVKAEDLERIGMAKPAVRRLLDCVKKKRQKNKKSILDKVV